MSDTTDFPYPIAEYGAEAFWQACNEDKLVMQRCNACGKYRWQPAPLCTFCASNDFEWSPLSGRGTIATWTVVTHPVHPAAVARVPYVVVEVELEEQAELRMISNLIDADHDAITFNLAVAVKFSTHPNGQKLPVFKLV
jgi:uncharacterized OB-fold protein